MMMRDITRRRKRLVRQAPVIQAVTRNPWRSALSATLVFALLLGHFVFDPPKAEAAPYAFVQAVYRFRNTGVSSAFNSANTAGNTIIVGAAWAGTGTPTIADTLGNSYTLARKQSHSTSWSVGVWVAHGIAGGANSVTLTGGAASYEVAILEYSGLVSTDQVAGSSGLGGTPSSGLTPETTQDNEMVFGFAMQNAASPTVGSGFTSRVSGVNSYYVRAEDKRVTATGTQAATWGSTASSWISVAVTLREEPLPEDQTPPVVSITTPAGLTDSVAVTPYPTLEGTASDDVGVTECNWSNNRGSEGDATGTTTWSASDLNLYPGDNVITATCLDEAANEGTDSITVTFTPNDDGGGFVEDSTSTTERPVLFGDDVGVPSVRGVFMFPEPYGTKGYRITQPSDCGGSDCVNYIGYAYWSNMNNSAGEDIAYLFAGLSASNGGSGPNLFSINKLTDVVTNVGPLFDSGDVRRNHSGEGWYFSGTQATSLYVIPITTSPRLQRYDVLARTTDEVLDISDQTAIYGSGRYVAQAHSSNDDNVHSFTVKNSTTFAYLGCGVYIEDEDVYKYFPALGEFDECQVDRSGRWLVTKEQIDGLDAEDNRVIDLETDETVTILYDQPGAGGHSDMGYGYMAARDNWYEYPAVRLWEMGTDPMAPGTVIHREPSWDSRSTDHISWNNATTGPLSTQFLCGSTADGNNGPRTNESSCFRPDSSLDTLVLAPIMTDMNTSSAGGDDYAQMPKGNVDPTGNYFVWSSNLGTNRTDVMVVKIPYQLLLSLPGASDVAFTGNMVSGQTLTGSYTYFDSNQNAEATSTFRWLSADTEDGAYAAISGATAETYELTPDDIGKFIKYEVTPVSTEATGEPVLSAARGPVSSSGVPSASNVQVSGTAAVGQTLTGSYTYFDSGDVAEGTSTFRWLSASTSGGSYAAIDGATGLTYDLVASDIGKFLKFEVTPVSVEATGTPVQSSATGQVNSSAAPTASDVAISGTAEAGQTLTGSYTYEQADNVAEGSSTLRWLSSDTQNGTYAVIDGATAETYDLTDDDVGKYLKFQVTPVATVPPTTGAPVQSSATAQVAAEQEDDDDDNGGGGGGGGGGRPRPTPPPAPTPVPTPVPPPPPGSSGTGSVIRLVNDQGTYYLIHNGVRQGVTSPEILATAGLNLTDAVPATAADLAIQPGAPLPPQGGSLVMSQADQTVYLLSLGQRHPFVSAAAFLQSGYDFSNVLIVTDPELQALPKGPEVIDPNKSHLPGTDILDNGTVYWIDPEYLRRPYPSLELFNSWRLDNDFSKVVPANAADLLLPIGSPVYERTIL